MARYRVTVDTGGTFSDFVYLNEETDDFTVAKLPSTPDDPSRAILPASKCCSAQGVSRDDIFYFCHGTTVGTNALLEGKGVKTGLLVTQGFRGIYEVAEQSRPHGSAIFDIFYDRPPLLVPESRTGEVNERVDFRKARCCCRSTKPRCAQPSASCKAQGVKSVAVCLLFSFLNPEHEERACATIIRRGDARRRRVALLAMSCRRSASIIGSARP